MPFAACAFGRRQRPLVIGRECGIVGAVLAAGLSLPFKSPLQNGVEQGPLLVGALQKLVSVKLGTTHYAFVASLILKSDRIRRGPGSNQRATPVLRNHNTAGSAHRSGGVRAAKPAQPDGAGLCACGSAGAIRWTRVRPILRQPASASGFPGSR